MEAMVVDTAVTRPLPILPTLKIGEDTVDMEDMAGSVVKILPTAQNGEEGMEDTEDMAGNAARIPLIPLTMQNGEDTEDTAGSVARMLLLQIKRQTVTEEDGSLPLKGVMGGGEETLEETLEEETGDLTAVKKIRRIR